MCIRCETREKARRSLAFSRVSKPHTHITYMLRQCTSIVYICTLFGADVTVRGKYFILLMQECAEIERRSKHDERDISYNFEDWPLEKNSQQ